MSDDKARGRVTSLLHGTQVFDMFSRDRRTVSVGEIALALKLHNSSASRIAATLASASYLTPVDGERGRYRLSSKFVELGQIANGHDDLVGAAAGPLAALAQELGDTAHLGVIDGLEAITVAVVDGWRAVRMHSFVGKRSPAHASSMGKVLLSGQSVATVRSSIGATALAAPTEHTMTTVAELIADLERIRQNGFGTDIEELEEGMCCVAAPVVVRSAVVASVSVSGPTSRFTEAAIPGLAQRTIDAADEVGRELSGHEQASPARTSLSG